MSQPRREEKLSAAVRGNRPHIGNLRGRCRRWGRGAGGIGSRGDLLLRGFTLLRDSLPQNENHLLCEIALIDPPFLLDFLDQIDREPQGSLNFIRPQDIASIPIDAQRTPLTTDLSSIFFLTK